MATDTPPPANEHHDDDATLVALSEAHLPGVIALWSEQHARTEAGWMRALPERRALVEQRLRALLGEGSEGRRTMVALSNNAVVAFLSGREVRLPRGSTYLTYMPGHFLNIGADDWGVASLDDAPALAALYGEIGRWILSRGGDTHIVAVEPGDERAGIWADLGFARQDCYAFLPCHGARDGAGHVTVRRAAPEDLDIATTLIVAEAQYHHNPPIFAYAPPNLTEAKRRSLAESLHDAESYLLLAEVDGQVVGALSAYYLADSPFWASTALPTPCIFIDSTFVLAEARGRGALRSLVSSLAAMSPGDTVGLFVTYLPANLGAARAWSGLGFRPFARIQQRRLDPRAARQWHGGEGN